MEFAGVLKKFQEEWNFQRSSRKWNFLGPWFQALKSPRDVIRKFCGVTRSGKKLKILQGGWGGEGWWWCWMAQTPLNPHLFFFWNSPLLNGLNPNLGNIVYSGKFSKFREKKCLIRQKKKLFERQQLPVQHPQSLLRLFYQIKIQAVQVSYL